MDTTSNEQPLIRDIKIWTVGWRDAWEKQDIKSAIEKFVTLIWGLTCITSTSTRPRNNGVDILSNVKAAPSLPALRNNYMNNPSDPHLDNMNPHPTKYSKSKPSPKIGKEPPR
ncbi:hypothetical protein Fot_21974 [Forsythia ovata]|uniref:Uncharacterized protein n=1 Tax=Forsythia ovata TaxID=205694 RepID=A0ABD1UXE9_9LAMI